jgi:ABC-type branched-subunit amino acid transport system substrate-binding protein
MEMDRRQFLDLLGSGILLSAAPSTVSGPKAALLLPVTGASAELGLSMQRAVHLAQSGGDGKTAFPLFDTGDTPEGAAKAATAAIEAGAGIILGPVFGRQMQAVSAAVAGRAPIVSFSNSNAAPGSGVFTFGITPSQSVSAILQYARGRGVRRFALVGTGSGWSEQAKRAAERLAPEIGLQLVEASAAPDAALLTGDAAQFAASAPALRASGVQLLGTLQAMNQATGAEALEGAWLAAPDPAAFAVFAESYRRSGGAEAGAIAALAYDAARIVQTLSSTGKLNQAGLLDTAGFPGVTGAVRFRPDGRCVRELAILVATSGAFRAVGSKAGL